MTFKKTLAFIIYLRTILSKNYYTSYNMPILFSKFSDPLRPIHIKKKMSKDILKGRRVLSSKKKKGRRVLYTNYQ